MEEEGGREVAIGVADTGDLDGAPAAQANGDGLVLALVDELLVGGGEDLLSLGNAAVAVGVALDLALPGVRLNALQASGNLGRRVGDHEDLESQRQHVLVDPSCQKAGAVGSGLALLEDVGERLQGISGHGDGGIVERVAHGGRFYAIGLCY